MVVGLTPLGILWSMFHKRLEILLLYLVHKVYTAHHMFHLPYSWPETRFSVPTGWWRWLLLYPPQLEWQTWRQLWNWSESPGTHLKTEKWGFNLKIYTVTVPEIVFLNCQNLVLSFWIFRPYLKILDIPPYKKWFTIEGLWVYRNATLDPK